MSTNIREFIVDQIASGRSDGDIEEALVQAYGTQVLLAPPSAVFGALAWILPVVAFAIGATTLTWVLTRDRGRAYAEPTDEDRALVERARRRR